MDQHSWEEDNGWDRGQVIWRWKKEFKIKWSKGMVTLAKFQLKQIQFSIVNRVPKLNSFLLVNAQIHRNLNCPHTKFPNIWIPIENRFHQQQFAEQ